MSLSVSALIPTYNSWDGAARCARAVLEHSGDRIDRILIVDDASDETQPDGLPKRVQVVRNETNQGVIRSENIGFSRLDTDIVVIFDSDARPLMDFVPGVRRQFRSNPRLGAMVFHLVDRNGHPTGAATLEPTVSHFLLGQRAGGFLDQLRRRVGSSRMCVHSCATAFRRAAYKDVDGFDEGFDFLDYDIDFSMRLHDAGWDVDKSDEVVAFHEGGGSPQSTSTRVLRWHRNRWRLLMKHEKVSQPILLKIGLFYRHSLEYGIIRVAGPLIFRSHEEYMDKLSGRAALLRRVGNAYHPPQSSGR